MKRLVSLFAILAVISTSAQFTVGIKIGGLAFHQQKVSPNYYRLSMDKKGHWVGYLGCSLTAGYQFNPYIGIKVIQTLMPFDCAGKFSGITHFGIDFQDRIVGIQNTRHNLSATVGPLFYYRKNWKDVPNYYVDEGFVKTNQKGEWERKFIWYGGQIQYDYYFNEQTAISTNFLPGYPYIYTFMTGVQTVLSE